MVQPSNFIFGTSSTFSPSNSVHWAIRQNKSFFEISSLITPQNVNQLDENKKTPLELAVENNNSLLIIGLLKAGANPKLCPSILYVCLKEKKLSSLETLLTQLPLDLLGELLEYRSPEDETPLYKACSFLRVNSESQNQQNIGIIKLLLNAGARVDVVCGKEQRTPLHAATELNNKEVISILLDTAPALANKKDNQGLTPFYLACKQGNPEVVENFIAAKADGTVKCGTAEETVLHIAVKESLTHKKAYLLDSTKNMTSILIRYNPALANVRDKIGCTPLYYACQECHFPIIKLLLEEGKSSLECGPGKSTVPFVVAKANPNSIKTESFSFSTTSYGVDLAKKKVEILSYVLRKYPSIIDEKDENQCTILYYFFKQENRDGIHLLVDLGADLNLTNGDNEETYLHAPLSSFSFSPFSFAVFGTTSPKVSLISDLLKLKPELVHVKDKNGFSPLYYSVSNHHSPEIVKLLLGYGAKADETVEPLEKNLLHVCKYGNVALLLIEKFPNLLNKKDKLGFTPLYYACKEGLLDVVQALVDSGASTSEKQGSNEESVLHPSSRAEITSFLLKRNSHLLQTADKQGLTPLYHACTFGPFHSDIGLSFRREDDFHNYLKNIRTLVDGTLSLDQKFGPQEETVLHTLIRFLPRQIDLSFSPTQLSFGFHLAEKDKITTDATLLDSLKSTLFMIHQRNPQLIHIRDKSGNTPLYYACSRDLHKEIISYLLSLGADIKCGGLGQTALHVAAKNHSVKFMKEQESSINLTPSRKKITQPSSDSMLSFLLHSYPQLKHSEDDMGYTPLYYACKEGCYESVKLLIQEIEEQETYGFYRETLLHAALRRRPSTNQIRTIRLLLSKKPSLINHKDNEGKTALYDACRQGSLEIVKLLVKEMKVDLHVRCGPQEETPLHTAIHHYYYSDHRGIIDLLLKTSPDLAHAKDSMGLTPLYYAEKKGLSDVIKILKISGAHSNEVIGSSLDLSHLTELNLSHTGITHKQAPRLLQILTKQTKLQSLCLSHNSLGDEGIKELSGALREKQLVEIQLVNVGMTDEGLTHLCSAMSQIPTLRKIALGHNPITDEGLGILKKALQGKRLESISLDYTKTTGRGMLKFLDPDE